MPDKPKAALDPAQVAEQIAQAIEATGCEYGIGGAIALGYWGQPRGTLDVDVTLFLPADQPTSCVRLLQSIGCTVQADRAIRSLTEHGFCQVEFKGLRVDIFLPTVPFYEHARQRRRPVTLGSHSVMIWDAETLCVFKMMFFRRKDLADLEQLLRTQGNQLDRDWVLRQLTEMYGPNDPRISQWQELVREQA